MTAFLECRFFATILIYVLLIVSVHASKYSAKCSFSLSSKKYETPCTSALFSYFSFNKSAEVIALPSSSEYLCNEEIDMTIKNFAVLVKRGECSFEQKSKIEKSLGAMAVILINSDNSVFPGGNTNSTYRSLPMPTVMIGNNATIIFENLETRANVKVVATLSMGKNSSNFSF